MQPVAKSQARLQENYDWIVLGDSPAALLTAALVARMGLSVLIVAEDAGKKWTVTESGQLIDLEPNFLMGLARMERLGGVVAECLSRLRQAPSEWNRLERPEVLFQAVTPHVRAGFSVQHEAFEREIRREAGAKPQVWLALSEALSITELLTHGFWRFLPERLTLRDPKTQAFPMEIPESEEALRKRLESLLEKSKPEILEWLDQRREVSQLFHSEHQREWLQAWLAAILGHEIESCTPYHALQLFNMARTAVRVTGGVSAFRQSILRLAVRMGAQCISPEADSGRIFSEDGKILGVQLGTRGSVVRGKGIAAGRDSGVVRSWMDEQPVDLFDPFVGLRVTLALSIHDGGLPQAMQFRTIWKESGAPAIEMERARPEEYGLPGGDYEVLFVRSVMPPESAAWKPEKWRTVLSRMHRQVSEVIPFLRKNEFRRFPDFEASDFVDQWVRFYGLGEPICRRELMRVPLRREKRKNPTPGIEGLFVFDGSHQPEWGSLGDFSYALEASAWIAHRSGLAGPLG